MLGAGLAEALVIIGLATKCIARITRLSELEEQVLTLVDAYLALRFEALPAVEDAIVGRIVEACHVVQVGWRLVILHGHKWQRRVDYRPILG